MTMDRESRWMTALIACALAGCAHTKQQALDAIPEQHRAYVNSPRGLEQTKRTWDLAQTLERAGLLHSAMIFASSVASERSAPQRVEALSAIVRLQERRGDDFLAPSMLNKFMTEPGAPTLPPDDAAHVAFLRAQISWRRARHEEALSLLALVPPEHRDFLRAERLRAGVLSDPRLTPAPRPADAISILARVERHPNADATVRAETQLALARLHYAVGHFTEARRLFLEAAASPSLAADAALGRAYSELQLAEWMNAAQSARTALEHGASNEARLVEALALHFGGKSEDAERVLAQLEAEPEVATDWEQVTPAIAYERAVSGDGVSPREKRVLLEDKRLQKGLRMLASFEAEIATVIAVDGWRGTAHEQELLDYLHANAGLIREACGNTVRLRLLGARREHAGYRAVGRVVAIEVALARRDLDAAIDRTAKLKAELVEPSFPHTDVMFRLAALKQARAEVMDGPEAEVARAEVQQLIKRLLDDASFPRREEAQRYLE